MAYSGKGELVKLARSFLKESPFKLSWRALWHTVEDSVGQGGVADGRVPMFNWQFAGDDGRAAAVAVVEHFHQVALVRVLEHRQSPIVDDKHVYL